MSNTIVENLPPYKLKAHNYGEDHENKIHSDEGAAKYGFAGALVPGVAVYAYLARPVLDAFGKAWLEGGLMKARFISPVYDGDQVTASGVVTSLDPLTASLELRNAENVLCAVGESSMPQTQPGISIADYPHAALPEPDRRRRATISSFKTGDVLGSLDFRLDFKEEMTAFLDDMVETAGIYRSGEVACHPAFIVARSNEILMSNVALGPWIHTSSEVSHHAIAVDGESLCLRGRVAELYEKRGNEYVVLDLALFGEKGRPIAQIKHSAIIRLMENG
ncbi:MAG: MaoC family dehydratase [Acidobacteria bacterium]|nr:MaoC family dehydratase [Acidobacteriota bacterium]